MNFRLFKTCPDGSIFCILETPIDFTGLMDFETRGGWCVFTSKFIVRQLLISSQGAVCSSLLDICYWGWMHTVNDVTYYLMALGKMSICIQSVHIVVCFFLSFFLSFVLSWFVCLFVFLCVCSFVCLFVCLFRRILQQIDSHMIYTYMFCSIVYIYILFLHIHTWYEQWFAHPKLKFNCHRLKWSARTARWLEHQGVARIPWCVESSWCARDGSEKGRLKPWPSMVVMGFSLNNPWIYIYICIYLYIFPKSQNVKRSCKSNYTIYFPGGILIYFFVCKMLFICIEGYIQDVWWSNVSQIAGGSVFISLKKIGSSLEQSLRGVNWTCS